MTDPQISNIPRLSANKMTFLSDEELRLAAWRAAHSKSPGNVSYPLAHAVPLVDDSRKSKTSEELDREKKDGGKRYNSLEYAAFFGKELDEL
jgi:hypothetical protein